MQINDIKFKTRKPPPELNDFVESFWIISNKSKNEHHVIILPDGRFDIIFYLTNNTNFKTVLKGLDTKPERTAIPAKAIIFAVSFKLPAVEYLFEYEVQSLIDNGLDLPENFWGITENDLANFENCCRKVSEKIIASLKSNIDNRKQKLFELIYGCNGTLSVKELSERVFWSSRQINRYFNQTFGISLKSYCNILRFKSSLEHIKKGKLYPTLNYADQNHLIREVKRMSGVTPKELYRNKNDRFILLSSL